MIKIKRGKEPRVLANNKNNRKRYDHKDVVKALFDMQLEKCCYCERYISDSGLDKHVEHFKPKAIFPELTNKWENLLLACPKCNGYKTDNYPVKYYNENGEQIVEYIKEQREGEELLINPSEDSIQIDKHLGYEFEEEKTFGEMNTDTLKGKWTIDTVGLNQHVYLKQRKELIIRLLKITKRLYFYSETETGADYSLSFSKFNEYKEDILELMDSKRQFSGLARAYVRKYNLDIKFNLPLD